MEQRKKSYYIAFKEDKAIAKQQPNCWIYLPSVTWWVISGTKNGYNNKMFFGVKGFGEWLNIMLK